MPTKVILHVIDNEPAICNILQIQLKTFFKVKTHITWKTCKPLPGEIVIHDIGGVGKKPPAIKGVCYLICSGDVTKSVDIAKPWDSKDLVQTIFKKLKKVNENEK